MSELDFAAEVLPRTVKILAITGTNGKSTVTTFAGQVSLLPHGHSVSALFSGSGLLYLHKYYQP